jgi:hypothetical protein
MGSRKGTGIEKAKARTKKRLTLSKETIKDLTPTERQGQAVKAGRIPATYITCIPKTTIATAC